MATRTKKTAPIVQTVEASETVMIPLSALNHSESNVRKVYDPKGIESLAASIAAEGIIQNLVVTQNSHGTYDVIAGGRRLQALFALNKSGVITDQFQVPCQVKTEASATAISLAENFHRESLHPADEFTAFKQMIDAGASMNEVTSKFKVTPDYVKRRMKLGNVSPTILDQYRNGKLNLDQIMALAITDNHAKQEALMSGKSKPGEWEIRRKLTANYTDSNDKRAKFVDPKDYKAAGGAMIADLFNRGLDGRAVNRYADEKLLTRLALEKLDAWARSQVTEAAFIHADVDFSEYSQNEFQRVPTALRDPTDEEAKRLADLEAESEAAEARLDEMESAEDTDSDEYDELYNRFNWGIDEDIRTIERMRSAPDERYSGKVGYAVSLNYQGEPKLHGPYVRKADLIPETDDNSANGRDQKTGADDNSLPDSITQNLSAIRDVIMSNALVDNPGQSVRIMTYQALRDMQPGRFGGHLLDIGMNTQSMTVRDPDQYAFVDQYRSDDERFAKYLAMTNDDLFKECMFGKFEDIFALFGYVASRCLSAGKGKWDSAYVGELEPLIRKQWKPSAGDFYGNLKKDALIALLGDKAPANADKMKRGDLAAIAERDLKGYLPDMFKDGE